MKRSKFVRGSNNVFADIGLPDADEHLLKAELVSKLDDTIKSRKLTQTAAGRLLGVGQPDLSKILRGHFREVSVARLLRFLARLGQDVEIVVKPNTNARRAGRPRVRAA